MTADAIAFVDDDGEEIVLDSDEAQALWTMTERLDAATVSGCPDCRSCVLAAVALSDVLEASPPHPRSRELLDLATDAPTLHVYVVDLDSPCRHRAWHDPGFHEWRDAVDDLLDDPRRPRS